MRLSFHIALILSILYCPWWATAIILICACFLLDSFYEAIIYGIAIDALYGTKFGYHGVMYAGTLFATIVFLCASAIRNRLVW